MGENGIPNVAAKPLSLELNGKPKNEGPGIPDNAVGAAGEVLPVEQDQPDDFAETERDDGEIVAAQAQDRKAQQDAGERSEDSGNRQADPERQREMVRQQRIGIRANRVEGDVTEIEEAGETNHDVQSQPEHRVGDDQDAEIDQVTIANGVKKDRSNERERKKQRRHIRADMRRNSPPGGNQKVE